MTPAMSKKQSASSLMDEVISENTKVLGEGVKRIQVIYEGALIHPMYQLIVECENNVELELRGRFNVFRRAKMSCKQCEIQVPETFPASMAKSKFGVGLNVDELEGRRQGLEACFLELYMTIFPTLNPKQQRLLASLLRRRSIGTETTKNKSKAAFLPLENDDVVVSLKKEEEDVRQQSPKAILANCEARVEITVDNQKHPLYIMRLTIRHGRGRKTLLALHPNRFAEFVAIYEMIEKFESKPVLPDFPPRYASSKFGFKLSDKIIQERRSRLETYFAVLFHIFHDLRNEEQDALLKVLPFDIIPIEDFTTGSTPRNSHQSSDAELRQENESSEEDDIPPPMRIVSVSTEIRTNANEDTSSRPTSLSTKADEIPEPPTRLQTSLAACSENLSLPDACHLTQLLGGGSLEFRMVYFILHSVFHLPDPDYGYASAHPDWFVTAKLVGNNDDDDDDDEEDVDKTSAADTKPNHQENEKDSALASADDANKRKKQQLLNREQHSSHLKSENEDIHWDPPVSMVFVANAQQELDEQRLLLCLYDRNLGGDDSMDSLVAYGVITNLKELHSSARKQDVSFTRLEVSLVDVDNRVTGAVIAGDIALMTPQEARQYANVITSAVVKIEKRIIIPSNNWFDWCVCSEFSGHEPQTTWQTLGFLKAEDYCNPYENISDSADRLNTLATDLDQASSLSPREQIVEAWSQNHNPDEEDENGFQYASSLSADAVWGMYPPCVQGCIRRSVWFRTTEISPETKEEEILTKAHEVRSALRRSTYHPLRASRLIRFNESQRRLVHDSQLHRGLSLTPHNALLHQALVFAETRADDILLDLSALSGEDGYIARCALKSFNISKALLTVLPADTEGIEGTPREEVGAATTDDDDDDDDKLKQLVEEFGVSKVSVITVEQSIHDMSDSFADATLVAVHLSSNALRVIEPHLIKFIKANPSRRLLCLGSRLATISSTKDTVFTHTHDDDTIDSLPVFFYTGKDSEAEEDMGDTSTVGIRNSSEVNALDPPSTTTQE